MKRLSFVITLIIVIGMVLGACAHTHSGDDYPDRRSAEGSYQDRRGTEGSHHNRRGAEGSRHNRRGPV